MKTKILLALLLNFLIAFYTFNQSIPLVYSVENTGADCFAPPLQSITELKRIDPLPDPFEWSDGSGRISSFEDWRCRRAEIGAEIQHYELGTKPDAPDTLIANFTADSLLLIYIVKGEDTLTLSVPITLPIGDGPFPALIGVGFFPSGSLPADLFTSRKIALIHFMESQITNAWSNVRGDGPFFQLYPDKTRGKFIAWAWGVSRIIDALEKCPEAKIDLSHLAISGCSYAGKIALFSGALDERIALTIAIESGGGGFTAWRVTETLSGNRETLKNAQGQAWYYQGLSQFNNAVNKLPYDHHELMAMIAPRALLVTGNPNYEWMADESGHVASKAAHEVWKAFGVPDRFGFSIVGGHDHCLLPESQRPAIEAFVEKFLLGDTTANTNIATSPFHPDVDRWISWWGTGEPPIFTNASETMFNPADPFQNYPNPFNPSTTIEYIVHNPSHVKLHIYNSMGQLIKILVDEFKINGKYSVKWDGMDTCGIAVPAGTYFYRINTGELSLVNKMVLVK